MEGKRARTGQRIAMLDWMNQRANLRGEKELGDTAQNRDGWRKMTPPWFIYGMNMPRDQKKNNDDNRNSNDNNNSKKKKKFEHTSTVLNVSASRHACTRFSWPRSRPPSSQSVLSVELDFKCGEKKSWPHPNFKFHCSWWYIVLLDVLSAYSPYPKAFWNTLRQLKGFKDE